MNFTYRQDIFGTRMRCLIDILEHFHSDAPKLREVALHYFCSDIDDLVAQVSSPTAKLHAELEKTLIMFPTPTISFSLFKPGSLSDRRYHFWTGVLRRFFPGLAERRALKLNVELCAYYSTIHLVKVW